MDKRTMPRWPALMVLAMAFSANTMAVDVSPFAFTDTAQTYSENFNAYRGSEATLPDHMFVTWDDRIGEPFQGVNTGAFTAYWASGSSDYSFGIRERNPVDLRDSRLFLAITNNSSVSITGFEVSYDVEAWFVGDRRNRIRIKYDDQLDADDRDTFETDIISTDNPAPEGASGDVDGSAAANRTRASATVTLTELDTGDDSTFTALAPGETAYFRWQFSNADGDGGSFRSGLAINNVQITALGDFPEPPAPPEPTEPTEPTEPAPSDDAEAQAIPTLGVWSTLLLILMVMAVVGRRQFRRA